MHTSSEIILADPDAGHPHSHTKGTGVRSGGMRWPGGVRAEPDSSTLVWETQLRRTDW